MIDVKLNEIKHDKLLDVYYYMDDQKICCLPSNKYKQSIIRKAFSIRTNKPSTTFYGMWVKGDRVILCESHSSVVNELETLSNSEKKYIAEQNMEPMLNRGWAKVNISEVEAGCVYTGLYFEYNAGCDIKDDTINTLETIAQCVDRCLYYVDSNDEKDVVNDNGIVIEEGQETDVDWIGPTNQDHSRFKLVYVPLSIREKDQSLAARISRPEL